MNKNIVSFGLKPKGETAEEMQKNYEKNWDRAEKAVKQGKVINLSDLMSQAEQIHLKKLES